MIWEIVVLAGLGSAVLVLAERAYRYGRGATGSAWPRSLVRELAAHKLECLGEPRQRVELELAVWFAAPCEPTSQERASSPS